MGAGERPRTDLRPNLPGLVEFWAKIIGEKGPPAKISGRAAGEQHWDLLDPIGVEELQGTLKSLTNSAVVMDKITATNLMSWRLPSLASVMNLILLTENLPAPLASARITLIPKTQTPEEHSD